MNIITTTQPAETLATVPAPAPTPAVASGSGKAKVAIGFLNQNPDTLLVVVISRILADTAGNAVYPAPVPALATIAAANAAYVTAVNALDRGKASTLRRDQARAVVVTLVRELALYVQQASAGDPVALASSGFPAQKGRGQPLGIAQAPTKVRLRAGGVSGTLRALCERQTAASAYQWRYATAQAPTVWTQLDPVTAASITLTGLVPTTQYIAQVRAIGAKGPSNWSDGVVRIAM